MQYSKHVLANGLRVITIPMPSLESVTAMVWVKTGSRSETDEKAGISHFLEHMFFKGSKKRPTARAISEIVDGIGGEFNASTNKDYTNFYIKTATDNLEIAMDVLSDMLLDPILDKKEIEKEKGTIVEEMKMYEDNPMYKIGDIFEQLIYKGNTLGRDIIGSEKTVRSFDRNDFVSYRDTYYYAENITLVVAGGITKSKVEQLSKKYFAKLASDKNKKSDNYEEFSVNQKDIQVKIHNKKIEQAHLIMGFLADGRTYKNRYAQSLLSVILGGGMSSRLFEEVREKRGLAYSISTRMDRYQEIGYIGTYAGVDLKRVDEAVKLILDEHYQVTTKKAPITSRELKKAKEYLKGHLALGLENSGAVASFFGEQELFLDKVLTPKDVIQKVEKVTMVEVNNEAKRLFRSERLNLALIGPFKDEEKFRKTLT